MRYSQARNAWRGSYRTDMAVVEDPEGLGIPAGGADRQGAVVLFGTLARGNAGACRPVRKLPHCWANVPPAPP
ncbi:MAG: hypothetical protein NVS9B6_16940 [Candidatus Limnocylindrales bacterium]